MTQEYLLEPYSEEKGNLFREKLLKWFQVNGRHNLPWKPQSSYTEAINLYRIWVSEIMLQQTQVITVLDYFHRFMEHFPTIEALAKGDEEEVLKLWEGLGYYSRARNLHHTAKVIVAEYGGIIPREYSQLIQLKGIGPTTAAAILSQGYNLPYAILDGNVRRVLSRILGVVAPRNRLDRVLQPYADKIASKEQPADYTQAIMDFGATLCTRSPLCQECFFSSYCTAYKFNQVSELPRPAQKRRHPTKEVWLLIFKSEEGRVFLKRRESKGVWRNLYTLPELEREHLLLDYYDSLQIDPINIEQLAEFKHRFSHYTLAAIPVIITLKDEDLNRVVTHYATGDFITMEAADALPKPKPIVDLLSLFIPFSLCNGKR